MTASIGCLSVQFTFTNTPTPSTVAYLDGSGTPQSAPVHSQFVSNLAAKPTDTDGSCIAQAPITFIAPTSGPSATLLATTVLSDAVTCMTQVTATANGIVGGPYNVIATSIDGVSTTFALTNTPGAPTLTATGGATQTATIGQPFATALQATLLAANGNPMAGQTVTFSPPGGASATLSANSAVTNASGVAQVMATANSTAGSDSVTATFGALTAAFSLTNALPIPGSITATGGTPQYTVAGTAFPAALQATVEDTNGNPMSSITACFAAPASGASAALSTASRPHQCLRSG